MKLPFLTYTPTMGDQGLRHMFIYLKMSDGRSWWSCKCIKISDLIQSYTITPERSEPYMYRTYALLEKMGKSFSKVLALFLGM